MKISNVQMASYNNINDLKKIIYLILFGLPVIASMDIDCNGKPFHCVNSTHFMICVDLGGGVSKTIDNFLISCPPTTECRGTNHFECEYVRLTTTVQPVQSSSVKNNIIENVQVDWEKIDVTTTMPGHRTSDLELSEKYFNGLSIPTTPILISTTTVNTNEGKNEELYKNDNNISVVTTPSYFMASDGPSNSGFLKNVQEKANAINLDAAEYATSSTVTIVTTATLRPHPELTPESATKPKVAAEAYTESVGFPVTEIYLKSSDVDEIKESSKTPDETLDVTEKSTLFEDFTRDTPFHVEYSPKFQLDSVIETRTSEMYETNTTLVAKTVPDTILDLITPKSDITESENNVPKPTIILENINLTNLEISKEISLNSTGSSVITVAQILNNLNSSGSENILSTNINVDSTTTNFVFDRYSTVNNTVDRSVGNKMEKISAEQAPAYTIPYPAEEPLTDNIKAADFQYFENSTSETPFFATTSEMVSDKQNESTVTSDSTHDSSFTDPQNQDNINHTSEGTWIAKESSLDLTSLDEDYISSIGPYSTTITETPINSYIPTGPLYTSVDPFSIFKQQTIFNLTNHDNTDSNPSVTILPILNSHISSQPFITQVHNEEDYNTIVTPSTLNPHPARPFTNYNDDFNPSVGLSPTLKIPTSDSQTPVSLVTNFHDNSNPTFLQSTTPTVSSSSSTTRPPPNYQHDINPAAVQSSTLKNHTPNLRIPQSLGTNLLDDFRPLIVQSSTSNSNSFNSKIPASQVTNLQDHSLPSIVELTIFNPHTVTSSSVAAESLTYYEEDSNLSVQISTSNPDTTNSRKEEEKNLESPLTNIQENSFPPIVQSSTSNPYTSNSQIPASPGTSFQDNFNPSIVQFATSYPQSSNSQIPKNSGIYILDNSSKPTERSPTLNTQTSTSQFPANQGIILQNNSIPLIAESSILNPHTASSSVHTGMTTKIMEKVYPAVAQTSTVITHKSRNPEIPENPVTNIQANFSASILQSFTSNPYPSNSHISKSPDTNLQDKSMVFIEESSISYPRSDTPSVDEGPTTNNQLNIDPAVAQTSTLNTHNRNSQMPESPVTKIQGNPNSSLVESSTLDPYTSYSEILAGLGTDLQDNSHPSSISNPPTATSSLVPAKPLTNYHKDSTLSVIQSSTIRKPHSSNSQIPESLVTKHQDNYIPSIVESSISNLHIAYPSVDIGAATNNQENVNPAIAQISTSNTHTSNVQIPASPVTNLQNNSTLSIVQSTTSNPHASNSQILLSLVTDLQDYSLQSSNLQTVTRSSVAAEPLTNNQKHPNLPGVQTLNLSSQSFNSKIPEITNLQDVLNPSFVESATFETHTSISQFPASEVTYFHDLSIPSVMKSPNINPHTSNSQILASADTHLQDNTNPSVVQSATSNLHNPSSQIPASSGKNLQDNFDPSIVQSATSNLHSTNSQIPASSGTNLQDNFNPSIVQFATSIPHTSNSQISESSITHLLDNSNPSIAQSSTLITHTTTAQFPASQVGNLQDNSVPFIVQSSISNLHTNNTSNLNASSAVDTGPPRNKQENFNPLVVQTSTTNLHSSNSQIPALQVTKLQDNSIPYIVQSSTLNPHTSNSQITTSPVINLMEDSITFVLPTTSSNLNISPSPIESSPSLPTASTSIKQLGFNPSPHTESNLNASVKPFPTQQNTSTTFVVQSLISNQPTYSTPVLTLPDKHNNNLTVITLSTSTPVIISKPVVTIPILSPHNVSQEEEQPQTPTYTCVNKNTGRYADNKDCRKFYICIGKRKPIAGVCPANTVFSEVRKQCTKNLSHCVRENEFQCVCEGRFGDVSKNNIYYICIRNSEATYVRFKFQCQLGYHLNKTTVKCTENVITPKSRVSTSSSIDSSSKLESEVVSVPERKDSIEIQSNKDKREFECESEGKFAHPSDCRKYFVCKKKKSKFRRKFKKCDSDEVFHKEKKKCVDADSYGC